MWRNLILDPHARFFGLYAAVMTAALAAVGSPWALLYAGVAVGLALLVWRKQKRGDWASLAAVCAMLAVSMNLCYEGMRWAVPAVRSARFDVELAGLDRLLFGTDPDLLLHRLAAPWLTNVLSACYMFFIPLLYFFLVRYFFSRREHLGRFYAGLFTVYGLGFLGYFLVPAAGPYLAQSWGRVFDLPGGFATALNRHMVVTGSNHVDVWPSLHCAISAYILIFLWRHERGEFFALLLPVAGLWLSTMYLGYHYFVDIVCGFALAGLAALVESRYVEREPVLMAAPVVD